MTDRPAPLVPPNVDLGGYGFMPLHGHRLFGSDFNARCNDAEWRAGVTLWWASWNQVPAGSLPDDDVVLCRLAGFGRDMRTWRKLRENALRGFILCSDGRLYHSVLAKLALEAWERRLKDRERKAKWRERINLSGDGNEDNGRDGDGDKDGTSRLKRSEVKRSELKRDLEGAALRALQAAAAGVAPPSQAGATPPLNLSEGAPGPGGPAPRTAAAAPNAANPDAHPWLRAQLGKQGLAASPQATLEWEGLLKRIGVGKPKLVCELLGWLGKRGDVQFARQAEPLVDEWRSQRPVATP